MVSNKKGKAPRYNLDQNSEEDYDSNELNNF